MLKTTPEVKLTESPPAGSTSLRTLFESEESNLLALCVLADRSTRSGRRDRARDFFCNCMPSGPKSRSRALGCIGALATRRFTTCAKADGNMLSDGEDGEIGSDQAMHHETPDELIAHMETVAQLRRLVGELPEKESAASAIEVLRKVSSIAT